MSSGSQKGLINTACRTAQAKRGLQRRCPRKAVFPWLCSGIVLMALCVAYGFASAQAAIFSAAEAARFHTGERHMYPRPARLHLVKLRFARLRSAKHCFLDILMTPDRLWRYPLRVPLHAAVSCGGVVAQSPLCRVSGGQGYLQHNSAAERFPSPACLPSFHAIQAGKNVLLSSG